jgi:hypothetical protein
LIGGPAHGLKPGFDVAQPVAGDQGVVQRKRSSNYIFPQSA